MMKAAASDTPSRAKTRHILVFVCRKRAELGRKRAEPSRKRAELSHIKG